MVSTRKVIALTATAVGLECSVAGVACATSLAKGAPGAVSEALAVAIALLVIVMLSMALCIRWLSKAKNDSDHLLWQILAKQLGKDTDLTRILKIVNHLPDMMEKIETHDKLLKPVVDDYMRRKAEDKQNDLPPL